MHDVTAKQGAVTPVGQKPNYAKHHKRFPTTAWLRRRAPRNVPLFAFEYGDTGAGNDAGIAHNWAAFDAVEIVPQGIGSRVRGLQVHGEKVKEAAAGSRVAVRAIQSASAS